MTEAQAALVTGVVLGGALVWLFYVLSASNARSERYEDMRELEIEYLREIAESLRKKAR